MVVGCDAVNIRGFTVVKPTWTQFNLGSLVIYAYPPRTLATKASGFFWYPAVEQFSTGELLTSMSTHADDNGNLTNPQDEFLATNGRDFSFLRSVDDYYVTGGAPFLARPDGSIFRGSYLPIDPVPKNGSDTAVLSLHRVTHSNHGLTRVDTPAAISVTFPHTLQYRGDPSMPMYMQWFGPIIVRPGGEWLTTMVVCYTGQTTGVMQVECMGSVDLGLTWTYRGTCATAAQVQIGGLGDEGASEPSLCLLADGRLMMITRCGTTQFEVAYRSFCTAGDGVTWTTPQALPIGLGYKSPILKTIANGTTVLVAGIHGPGYAPAFTVDNAATWLSWDMTAYHNAQAAINPTDIKPYLAEQESRGYCGMIETLTPNRLMIVYDYLPTYASAQPNDGHLGPNRMYGIEIGVGAP